MDIKRIKSRVMNAVGDHLGTYRRPGNYETPAIWCGNTYPPSNFHIKGVECMVRRPDENPIYSGTSHAVSVYKKWTVSFIQHNHGEDLEAIKQKMYIYFIVDDVSRVAASPEGVLEEINFKIFDTDFYH